MQKKKNHLYPNLPRVGVRGILLNMFEDFERPAGGGFGATYTPWPKTSGVYYRIAIHRMKKRGWIKESCKEGKRFMKLTKKGRVQALLRALDETKALTPHAWDGKWRIGLFDIPEEGKHERDKIRWTLKKVGFQRLQKSVYVYPFEIPRGALLYLRESGLDRFVRFMRVDQMDDDKELRRKFKFL